jgi:hypothetical protein
MKTRLPRSAAVASALLILLTLAVTPAFADSYSNGPINGTNNAWNISNQGIWGDWSVADSFPLSSATTVTSFSTGLWLSPGDSPTAISWAITTGTSPDFSGIGGTASVSGTGTIVGGTLSNSYLSTNGYGYDLYTTTVTGLNVPLAANTTYWLELFNATTSGGNPVFWDENDGPSAAYQNLTGPLDANSDAGSEAFTINPTTAVTPEPGTCLMFGTGFLGLMGAVRRRFSI